MEARLVELEDREDVELLRRLMRKYHAQGVPPGAGAARHSRFFALAVQDGQNEYWVAGAWLHDSTPFRFVAMRFGIPLDTSYFIRRICKFAPGDWLSQLLTALAERMREEGKKALWSLGLPGHSNAVYKRAGFKEVGRTSRSEHPVFVKWLEKEEEKEEWIA